MFAAGVGVLTLRRLGDVEVGFLHNRSFVFVTGSLFLRRPIFGHKKGTTVQTINFNAAMTPEQRRLAAQAAVRLATAIEEWDNVDVETRKLVIRNTIMTLSQMQAAAGQRLGLMLLLNTDLDLARYLDINSLRSLGDPMMGAFAFIKRVLQLEGDDQEQLLDMFSLPFTGEDASDVGANAAVLGYADGSNPLALSPTPSDDSDGSSAETGETDEETTTEPATEPASEEAAPAAEVEPDDESGPTTDPAATGTTTA